MDHARKRRHETPEHQPEEHRPSKHHRPERPSAEHQSDFGATASAGAWATGSNEIPIIPLPPLTDDGNGVPENFNHVGLSLYDLGLPPDFAFIDFGPSHTPPSNDAFQEHALLEHSVQLPSSLQRADAPPSTAPSINAQHLAYVPRRSNNLSGSHPTSLAVAAQPPSWAFDLSDCLDAPLSTIDQLALQRPQRASCPSEHPNAPFPTTHAIASRPHAWVSHLPNHRHASPSVACSIAATCPPRPSHSPNNLNAPPQTAHPVASQHTSWAANPPSNHADAVSLSTGSVRSQLHTLAPPPARNAAEYYATPPPPQSLSDSFIDVDVDVDVEWQREERWPDPNQQAGSAQREIGDHTSLPLHLPTQPKGLPTTPTSHPHYHHDVSHQQHAYPTPPQTHPHPTMRQFHHALAQKSLYSATTQMMNDALEGPSDPTRYLAATQMSHSLSLPEPADASRPSQAPRSRSRNQVFCPQCRKGFEGQAALNKHAKIHREPAERPNECDVCGKKFNEKKDLRRHLETASHRKTASHGEEASHGEATSNSGSVERRWLCSVPGCASGLGEGNPRKDNCRRHIQTCHPEVEDAEPVMREA